MTEHDPAAASHARLFDTGPCPVCGLPLSAGVCRWCGTDLTGADGARLLELATVTADALAEQRELLASFRARAGRRRAAAGARDVASPWVPRQRQAPRAPSWPEPVGGVGADRAEPTSSGSSTSSPRWAGSLRAAAAARVSAAVQRAVQRTAQPITRSRSLPPGHLFGLLAGLLAGSLAVAVAYSPAGRAWQAGTGDAGPGPLVLLAVLVTAGIWWSGRQRPDADGSDGWDGWDGSAGADGSAVVVLVLGVPWLIRAGGLLGTDRATSLGFLTAAVTGVAVALLGWGVLGRLRAAVTVGTLLAPVSPVLAAWWASSSPGVAPGTRAPLLAAGLLVGALLTTVRGVGAPAPARRAVAGALAFGMLAAAVGAAGLALAGPTVSASAATVAAVLPLVTLLQSVPDRSTRWYRFWQLGAAALTPLAGGVVARLLVQLVLPVASPVGSWWPLAVGAAGTTVLVSRRMDRYDPFRRLPQHLVPPEVRAESARHRRRVADVAHVSALLAALGLVAFPARQVVAVVENALPPWRHGPGLVVPGGPPLPYLLAVALLGVLAWMLRRAAGPVSWVAPALAGTALVAVPLCPGTPLWAGLSLLGLVSVGSARLAHLPGREGTRRPAQVVAAGAAVLAFVAGLATAMLSAPVGVACAAGLLAVRRRAVARNRPWLFALATSSLAVVAGSVAALLPGPPGGRALVVAFAAAGTAAVVAVAHRATGVGPAPAGGLVEAALGSGGALTTRGIGRTSPQECAAVVVTSGVTALVALTPALGAHPSGPVGALAIGLLLVAVVAGRSLPVEGTCGWGPRVLSAAAPPLTGLAVASAAVVPAGAAQAWAPAVLSGPSLVVLSATLAVALAATGIALAGRLSPDDPRRRPGELGVVLAAAGCVASALAVTGAATWWGVAVVLAAGSAAGSIPGDRRWLAWPTAGLLVAASWTWLAVTGVRVVEVYTLVAAGAVAALALTVAPAGGRRRSRLQWVALAVAVAPGVVASAASPAWRPLVWLTGSGLVVLVVLARPARPARRGRPGRAAVLLVTAVGAASAGTVHALGEIGRHALAAGPPALGWTAVEAWSSPTALLIAVCAVVHLALGDAASLAPRVGVRLVALVAGPTALAAALEASSGSGTGLRAAALLLAGGALATWSSYRPGHPVLTSQLAWRAVGVAALGAVLGAAVRGPLDAWAMPLGVVLLVAGDTLAVRGARRDWWVLTPGLVVLLAPGVWLVLTGDGGGLREAVLVAVAAATAVTGWVRRRVPLVVGGLIAVAVTAARVGGPWLLLAGSRLPRWADVAVVAVVVLGLGAVRGRRGGGPVDRPSEPQDAA